MVERHVGVLGATSHVGTSLLETLASSDWTVTAFSRRANTGATSKTCSAIRWESLGALAGGVASPAKSRAPSNEQVEHFSAGTKIPNWISLIPIIALYDYFPMLAAYGAKRVVALSSTSRFTKEDSSDPKERAWAQELAEAEEDLMSWARSHDAEWVILRPTLIYGLGRDRNISVIAGFIRRFGFFPLLGDAQGLRQPIHARDVAKACIDTLISPVSNRAYTISGAERLTYREMVARVFAALKKPVRFLVVPIAVFRIGVGLLRFIPRFRYLSVAMAERMNRDLAFDHEEAAKDFGFSPSAFRLEEVDLPG